MGITEKQKWLIFIIVGILMFSISFYSHQREKTMIFQLSGKDEEHQVQLKEEQEENKTQENENVEKEDPPVEEGLIMVHVDGAVSKPNLYKLKEGDRLADAIKAAGGLTEKADQQQINLAMKLEDGIKIYIPAKGESVNNANNTTIISTNTNQPTSTTSTISGKININQATKEELTQLKGIGDALAKRIIEYRQQQGGFKSIEEIKNVKGIGDKKFQQIRDKIISN